MTDFTAIRELFRITEPCGFDNESLTPWMERYGHIPQVLRAYYTELGAHSALNATQDFLVQPHNFPRYMEEDYCIFYTENQEACVWGIRAADMKLDNPPVYVRSGEEWERLRSSVKEFLLAMAHLQAVLAMEYSSEEYWDIDEAVAERIEQNFPSRLADSDLYTGVRFFGRPGELIVIMNNNGGHLLMFAAEDEERLDELYNLFEQWTEQ
ncbi:hypothetical protein [Paenibacillus sp. FSL H8-0332]|uniref:hypothetical protein n=1 Tax=Paenibacillus sp. FSL H8-0332 TaxID=2954742 RepID=UPI0030CD7EF0